MRVIGIDPGSRYTGYGIIEKVGNDFRHVASGRINAIYNALASVLEEFPCDGGAAESIFTARNAMSTIKLGHARGVALLALRHASIDVHEYAPTAVKQAVTGYGRASKEAVGDMVKRLLELDLNADLSSDASDALAVAICHCQMIQFNERLTS